MKLTIDGVEYKLTWGLLAHKIACDRENITLAQLDTLVLSGDAYTLIRLVYSALENTARINEESLPFNFEKFCEWMDNQEQGVAKEIFDDYRNSKFLGIKIGGEATEQDSKKKAIKSRSRKSI